MYALKLGQVWYRVLVEKRKRFTAFFVDTGVRHDIQPTMEFHFLPSRYLNRNAFLMRISFLFYLTTDLFNENKHKL